MRELCGNIIEASQDVAMHVAVFYVNPLEDNNDGKKKLKLARLDMIRLVGLGQALALQACHRVRDLDWVIEQRLLMRNGLEHKALESMNGPGFNEVYGWCISECYRYGQLGMVAPNVLSSVTYSIRWALLKASNDAEDLMMYLNQPVPLAYYHLLEVMVSIYVVVACVALVPPLLWVAVVMSPIVTFFFMGFYTLGTTMLMDPFVLDSGFDTKTFLTSTLLNMQSLERHVPLELSLEPFGSDEAGEGSLPTDFPFTRVTSSLSPREFMPPSEFEDPSCPSHASKKEK